MPARAIRNSNTPMRTAAQPSRAVLPCKAHTHAIGRAMACHPAYRLWEAAALFLLGGFGYVGVELAWRGHSHWVMFLAGGAGLWLLQTLANQPCPLWVAAARGAAGVTAGELAAGLLCNRLLGMQIWDYSARWGNVAGQICPQYCLYWFLLCGWIVVVLRALAGSAKGKVSAQ